MSNHHIDWLSRTTELVASHKLALLCMADSADRQTGTAVPGLDNVMVWSGLSKSKALAAVAELIERGYLRRISDGRRGHRAEFHVNCPCPDHRELGSRLGDPFQEVGSREPDPEGEVRVPLGSPSSGTPPQLPQATTQALGAANASRGTRLHEGWCDQPFIDYALAQGFTRQQLDRIAEDFADYWTAQPGQKGVKLDWLATWRTWVRREADRRGTSAPRSRPSQGWQLEDPDDEDYRREQWRMAHPGGEPYPGTQAARR